MNKKTLGLTVSIALGSLFAAASAFAFGGIAVIVYNPNNGAFGSYHGVPTLAQARANAENLCDNGIGDCSVMTWSQNGWVALAVNGMGQFGTGGLHDSEYDAEESAVNNCENSAMNAGLAYGSCYVLRSLASFVDAPDLNGVMPNSIY